MDRVQLLAQTAINVIKHEGVLSFVNRFGIFLEEQTHRYLSRYRKLVFQRTQQQAWPREKPLVSIVIPCYNYGMFIRETIESVLAQTFQRFEILVIDDGSTDDLTRQVLHGLSYQKTRVIHQHNQGVSQTRNNGAAVACGKYICFLDADDLIEPTYLEKTLYVLESDEGVGSCYSWVRCFGESSGMPEIWKTEDLDPYFLKERNQSSSHGVVRREAWDRIRESNGAGFLSRYNGFEDWVFCIEMLECGYRGVAIEEPLIRYRIHSGSLGSTHKPVGDRLKLLHEEKRDFFYNRKYRKRLEERLCKRLIVENGGINLD